MVAVLSLHAGVDAAAVTKLLRGDAAGGVVHQERCVSGISDSFGLLLPRFKQRFTFISHSTGKCCSKKSKLKLIFKGLLFFTRFISIPKDTIQQNQSTRTISKVFINACSHVLGLLLFGLCCGHVLSYS